EPMVNEIRQPAIHGRLGLTRFENHKVLGPANVGILLQRMDCTIGGSVGQAKIAGDPGCLYKAAFFAGRKLSQKIAQRYINVRLVEGYPVMAKIAQGLYDVACESLEERNGLLG